MPRPLKRGEVKCIKALFTPEMLAEGQKCPCEKCSPELYESGDSGLGVRGWEGKVLAAPSPNPKPPIPALDHKSAATGEKDEGESGGR